MYIFEFLAPSPIGLEIIVPFLHNIVIKTYLLSPLTDAHITGANHLDWTGDDDVHKDPFDRILLAQAITENMRFMTSNKKITQFRQNCVIEV